jgi:uncharacterized protein YggT (Ycf19 family)
MAAHEVSKIKNFNLSMLPPFGFFLASARMSVIDAILNIAGLLLWLKWRDKGLDLSGPRISLIGTLRKAGPRLRQIWFLFGLLGLLILRPFVYWLLGSALNWTPQISLGVIAFPFRSVFFWRMFLFSFFSFGVALGIFYLCLLLLSILDGKNSSPDPMQNLIRAQLGKFDLLPALLKLFFPWLAMLVLWCLLNKPFIALGMLPAPKNFLHLLEQGATVGVGIYLAWKYLIVGILLLHLLNSYIYFGAWPFWKFIDNSARRILKLVSWIPLRAGKIDFAPLVVMALVIFAAEYGSRGLIWIYQRLPF